MASKSELKRLATLDPLWAAERIYELEHMIKSRASCCIQLEDDEPTPTSGECPE